MINPHGSQRLNPLYVADPGENAALAGKPLVYGMSITDACIDIDATEAMLTELAAAARERRVAS